MPATPEFRSEDSERQFWAEHDSTEFIDWQSAQRRKFPNLKATLRGLGALGTGHAPARFLIRGFVACRRNPCRRNPVTPVTPNHPAVAAC